MEPQYQREYELIQKTGDRPVTSSDINRALDELGIVPGDWLMMHCSLRRIGWHVGGSTTILRSIMGKIGKGGLLLMPAHSNDCSDPGEWVNPPVPESWKALIRREMPLYDPAWTPAQRLGVTAELFRNLPEVHRSRHPLFSVAAWGREAASLTAEHPLDFPNGIHSPLGRLYEHGATILLYGVYFDNCTMLHLAEYLAEWPGKKEEEFKAPAGQVNNVTTWDSYKEYEYDDDFEALGMALEQHNPEWARQASLGFGTLRAIDCRSLVDFAVSWMEQNRQDSRNKTS